MKKAQQGFTIIEIVVALVVLGVLMGAAATQLNRFRETSYQTAANNIVASMQQAINMKYASLSQALSASGNTGCNNFCEDVYRGAIQIMGNGTATICGDSFTMTNAPFVTTTGQNASTADLGGGWKLAGPLSSFITNDDGTSSGVTGGITITLTGPNGRDYPSEIPLLSPANFCGTPPSGS